MVSKLPETNTAPEATVPLADVVQDSAQQIWQAGLGAFNKAQVESNKAFEALVKEGVNLQRKTQSAAEESFSEAADKMSNIANIANNLSFKATGQWDKLENIFEDRVAKALQRLGVPCAKDIELLIARVEELTKTVQQLSAQHNVPPPPTTKAKAPRRAPKTKTTAPDKHITPD